MLYRNNNYYYKDITLMAFGCKKGVFCDIFTNLNDRRIEN